MTDPILTAARALARQIADMTDTALNEKSVRALHAFALKQQANGIREGRNHLDKIGAGMFSYDEIHIHLTHVIAYLEAQAKEIEK